MGNATVRGSEVEPGHVIKSAGRWYTVTGFIGQREWMRTADVLDSKGRRGSLLIFGDDDYPVKEA